MTNDQPSYREILPENLTAWVQAQRQSVVVNRSQAAELRTAGAQNVTTLPYGGPQRGRVWVEVQV